MRATTSHGAPGGRGTLCDQEDGQVVWAEEAAVLRPREAGSRRVRLGRAGASSVLATALSQGTLLGGLWLGLPALVASSGAFLGGALVNYLVGRSWAWGRYGRPGMRHEVGPYVLVVGFAGALAIGLTTLTARLVAASPSRLETLLLADAAYLGSYVLVFVVKFTLLDGWVFRRADHAAPASTGRRGPDLRSARPPT